MGVRILLGVLIKIGACGVMVAYLTVDQKAGHQGSAIIYFKNWENMSNYNFERVKIKQVGNIIESTADGLKL